MIVNANPPPRCCRCRALLPGGWLVAHDPDDRHTIPCPSCGVPHEISWHVVSCPIGIAVYYTCVEVGR